MHVTALAADRVPDGQVLQAVKPRTLAYCPGAQMSHSSTPASAPKVPGKLHSEAQRSETHDEPVGADSGTWRRCATHHAVATFALVKFTNEPGGAAMHGVAAQGQHQRSGCSRDWHACTQDGSLRHARSHIKAPHLLWARSSRPGTLGTLCCHRPSCWFPRGRQCTWPFQ